MGTTDREWYGAKGDPEDRTPPGKATPDTARIARWLTTSAATENHGPAIERWRADVSVPALQSQALVFALSIGYAAPLSSMLSNRPWAFHLYAGSEPELAALLWLPGAIYGVATGTSSWLELARDPLATISAVQDGLLRLDGYAADRALEQAQAACALWLDANSAQDLRTQRRDAIALSVGREAFDHRLVRMKGGDGPLWLLNLSVDTGSNGIFDEAVEHGAPGQAALLANRAVRSMGEPGTVWLRFLNWIGPERLPDLAPWAPAIDPDEQVDPITQLRGGAEIGRCFHLVAAAGELATSQGLTGWPPGAAIAAATHCMKAWSAGLLSTAPASTRAP